MRTLNILTSAVRFKLTIENYYSQNSNVTFSKVLTRAVDGQAVFSNGRLPIRNLQIMVSVLHK